MFNTGSVPTDGAAFYPASVIIEVSQVTTQARTTARQAKGLSKGVKPSLVHEADQPDLVFHFADAHELAGENGPEVDLVHADADASGIICKPCGDKLIERIHPAASENVRGAKLEPGGSTHSPGANLNVN